MKNTLVARLSTTLSFVQRIVSVCKNKTIQTIKNILYWSAVSAIGLLIAGVIFVISTDVAYADPSTLDTGIRYGGAIVFLITSLIYWVAIAPIGLLSVIMAFIFQIVINYPHGATWTTLTATDGAFVNVPSVVTGWRLVRDVCNIFFSLILVIIALANVLKIEAYSWKKLIPKFILMAILINFSKTICGVFTDLGTVAMATFGGSFGGSFGAAIVGAFGLPSVGSLITGGNLIPEQGTDSVSVLLGYMATGAMTLIFFVVITIFTVLVVFRIVMLWFLIVLSPLAYITRILPSTEKHSKDWWERFGRWVTMGPLITFFLWLSLSFAYGSTVGAASASGDGTSAFSQTIASSTESSGVPAPSTAFTSASPEGISNFIIAMLMLMASLQIITGMAKEAGKITGATEKFAWAAGGAMLGGGARWMGLRGNQLGNWVGGLGSGKSTLAQGTGGFFKGLGNLSLLTGSTFFNPKAYDNVVEGVRSVASDRSKKLASEVSGHNENLIQNHSLLAALAVLGGLGLRPTWVFENYLDPTKEGQGMRRWWGAIRFRSQGQEDYDKLEKDKKAAQDLLDKNTDHANGDYHRYSTLEEAQQALREAKNINALSKEIEEMVAQLKDPGQSGAALLDVQHPAVAPVIADLKARLKAQQDAAISSGKMDQARTIASQLAGLERTSSSGQISFGNLKHYGVYSDDSVVRAQRLQELTNSLVNAYGSKGEELKTELAKRSTKLVNSSAKDANGENVNIEDLLKQDVSSVAFTRLMTANSDPQDSSSKTYETLRAEDVQNMAEIESKMQALQTRLATYRTSDDLSHAAHKAHAVRDASKAIEGISDSSILLDRLAEAIAKKDQDLAEAIIKKVTAAGDLDMLTGRFMTRFGVANGKANTDGLELFRKMILEERLGMSDHDSFRIANDASLTAGFQHKQQSFALAYKVHPITGHLIRMDDKDRHAWTSAEFKKSGIRTLTQQGAAQWGYRQLKAGGGTEFHVDDAGIELVKAFQYDLTNPHYFDGWSADARFALSEPQSIARLRDAGINEQLISMLQNYRNSTQRDINLRFAA